VQTGPGRLLKYDATELRNSRHHFPGGAADALENEADGDHAGLPHPRALAASCQQATGLELHPESGHDFARLTREDGLFIGFQRADGYQAPSWPGQSVPQQLHLDFAVDDFDEAETLLLELGAAKPQSQPGGDRWRVLTDPAGHPFCLTSNPPP
jgi:hypothetical protein